MNILVTGGAGYIGSHTCVELLELGHTVVIVDNFVNSSMESINRIEKITNKKVTFYELDVCDKVKLSEVFDKESIDAVIHFAGLKAVGESVAKPLTYYQNNLLSTMTLIEVMAEHNVYKLVFSSSATVYGLNNVLPLVETMPTSATNPYGYTKLTCEQILQDVQKTDEKWAIALLRYFNPIGAHQSGLIGENPNGIPNNLMPFISQVAVGRREKLSIFGHDYDTIDGTGVRDYIHVVDLAIGHIKAVEKINEMSGTHIYNLGSGQGTSVLELVEKFKAVNNIDVPYELVDKRPGDVAVCFANADKAWEELQWKTEKTIEDMCVDTWNFQSNNPKGY